MKYIVEYIFLSQTVTHNTNCQHNMYITAFYGDVNSLHVILGHVHHRCVVVACALTILIHFQSMDTGATGQSGQSAHGPVGVGCSAACASATIQRKALEGCACPISRACGILAKPV